MSAADATVQAGLASEGPARLPSGVVTFVLTDVDGSTALWERNPAAASKAVARHDELIATLVSGHGGVVLKTRGQGDSSFCVFERATDAASAATEIQLAFESEPWPTDALLRVRVALHTGEADLRDNDYYGAAIGRCARLLQLGRGGQTLVSGTTADIITGSLPQEVALEYAGTHELKDVPRPQQVFELRHPSVAAPRGIASRGGGAVVGRDSEMAVLLAALDHALCGSGELILVVGDAGMGKTALAAETARRAATGGAIVAWSRCWDAGGAPPLWPWAALMRALVEQVGSDTFKRYVDSDSPLVHLVPEILRAPAGRGGTGKTDRFELMETVDRLLGEVARERALVLVFDDLHAADEASLQILRFVARSLRGRRILILGTYLENEVKDLATATLFADLLREARRIEVGPLSLDAAREVYEDVTGSPASDALVAELHAVSEGNPLLLREASRSFATASAVRRGDHSLGFRVPRGARDILRRRLAPLPEDVLRVLAVAAVIGRDFDPGLAGEVAAMDHATVSDLLQTAIEAGVLREATSAGAYTFSHVLLRETVYEGLRMSERMRLHARVAETIERRHGNDLDGHVDQLAHHFFKAAQGGDTAKTLGYSVQAAKAATARGAHREAARLYQRALKTAELGGASSKQRAEISAAAKAAEKAAAEPLQANPDQPTTTGASGSLRREGDFWTVEYGGRTIRLKESKGVAYLQRLLQNPGREIHVLELARIHAPAEGHTSTGNRQDPADGGSIVAGGSDPLLDERAKDSYRRRINELRGDIEEANEFNDPERAARAQAELDALTQHLAAALGLGGRDRQASSDAERARLSVSKAIRAVLAKIEESDPELGEHLRATIRTGFYCSYVPDPRSPLHWGS